MGIHIFSSPTWYDQYQDDADLAQVQTAITQYLKPSGAVDWPHVLAGEQDELSFDRSYFHAAMFSEALTCLCDEEAPSTQRIDIVPFDLLVPAIDLSTAGQSWRVYSSVRIRSRWYASFPAAEQDRLEQIAAQLSGVPSPADNDALAAYYWVPLVQVAQRCEATQLPGGVRW